MKQEIKQAFKNETIEHVCAFNTQGDQVWLTHNFDMFVVEGGGLGRKAFATFNGAFNRFIKEAQGNEIEIAMQDFEVVDVDTFMTEVA